MKNHIPTTRNIAKSGKMLNFGGFHLFQPHLGLIVYHSQSASCHIAKRYGPVLKRIWSTKSIGLTTQSDKKTVMWSPETTLLKTGRN